MRLIDADALKENLKLPEESGRMGELLGMVINAVIEDAPIIKEYKTRKWIPCSERLPENDDWQIVTILDEHGDTPYRYSDFGWYLDKAECWIIDAEQRTDVIAWMPLPEPWRG